MCAGIYFPKWRWGIIFSVRGVGKKVTRGSVEEGLLECGGGSEREPVIYRHAHMLRLLCFLLLIVGKKIQGKPG